MPTGDYANHRYSALKQINKENVGKLQVAWTFSTGVLRGHEGAPLVIGDVMYLHAPFPNTVYALDLNNDGKILWTYEPKQDPNVIPVMCCDTVNRGLAYADGKIFLHQADTTLVALDAKSGKVAWSVKDGVTYAHAPARALSRVAALRIHLDDSGTHNGPLRVLPGTHTQGVLTDDAIQEFAQNVTPVDCLVPRGGVLAMKPLLVHASSKSQMEIPRRVLHIEYCETAVIDTNLELTVA